MGAVGETPKLEGFPRLQTHRQVHECQTHQGQGSVIDESTRNGQLPNRIEGTQWQGKANDRSAIDNEQNESCFEESPSQQ